VKTINEANAYNCVKFYALMDNFEKVEWINTKYNYLLKQVYYYDTLLMPWLITCSVEMYELIFDKTPFITWINEHHTRTDILSYFLDANVTKYNMSILKHELNFDDKYIAYIIYRYNCEGTHPMCAHCTCENGTVNHNKVDVIEYICSLETNGRYSYQITPSIYGKSDNIDYNLLKIFVKYNIDIIDIFQEFPNVLEKLSTTEIKYLLDTVHQNNLKHFGLKKN
jgi:hypothetical protein